MHKRACRNKFEVFACFFVFGAFFTFLLANYKYGGIDQVYSRYLYTPPISTIKAQWSKSNLIDAL